MVCSEPMVRGMMMTFSLVSHNFGLFVVLTAGAILSWRQVALICALFPIVCLVAVFFVIFFSPSSHIHSEVLIYRSQMARLTFCALIFQVPESPSWLLSKNRPKDALKSLQWLRGWVSPQTVHSEFTELKQFNGISNACISCVKQSIKCCHTKVTFTDKIQELKRKRSLKPFLIMFCLQFFAEFSGAYVWRPYIIQVLNAFGTPINASWITVVNGALGTIASILLISIVKKCGRRKIYLTSISIVTLCSFGLGENVKLKLFLMGFILIHFDPKMLE